MSEEISMNDMMNQIDSSMKKIHKGDVIKGRVISVSENEIVVNIGYITDGIIPKAEFEVKEEENLKDLVKTEDEIEVYVLKVNDGEGSVLLSQKKAKEMASWRELGKIFKTKEKIKVTVKDVVKGGVITFINGIRAFIPASHLSINYVKDLNEFKGKTLEVQMIEFNKSKGKVVLSRKVIEQKEEEIKKEKLWESLEEGKKVKGIVRRLEKFGAFVDIGGVDGLVHNSQLSWGRVKHPSEVVSIGDEVEVFVLDFDKESGRISLALKDVKEDPWNHIETKYKTGDVVQGTVVKLMDFGAFVELEKGIEGLVHISQICDENIAKPSDKLNKKDKVKVKILDVNGKEKRISLSIKEAVQKPKVDVSKFDDSKEDDMKLGDLFGDKLKDLF